MEDDFECCKLYAQFSLFFGSLADPLQLLYHLSLIKLYVTMIHTWCIYVIYIYIYHQLDVIIYTLTRSLKQKKPPCAFKTSKEKNTTKKVIYLRQCKQKNMTGLDDKTFLKKKGSDDSDFHSQSSPEETELSQWMRPGHIFCDTRAVPPHRVTRLLVLVWRMSLQSGKHPVFLRRRVTAPPLVQGAHPKAVCRISTIKIRCQFLCPTWVEITILY